MSSRGRSTANGKGSGGGMTACSIPPASSKVVQSLKEIVNCPEHEIYAMLKECNMDPNDAINRLLSQDPFHEVKTKREKKKENKDSTDSRSRGIITSNRGNKGSMDRGRGASGQFSSFESGALHGKPPYRKDGQNPYSSSFAASGVAVNSLRQLPVISDPASIENKISAIGAVDDISMSSQPSFGVQSAWSGVPGQVSMADIVKKGRSQAKFLSTPNRSELNVNNLHYDFRSPQDNAFKASELNPEPGVAKSMHAHANDGWPLVEQPSAVTVSSVLEPAADSESYADSSKFTNEGTSQHMRPQLDEIRVAEGGTVESLNSNHIGPASVSGLNMHGDSCGGASLFDDDLYEKQRSYQPQRDTFETHEDASVAVSSADENFQRLCLQEDQFVESEKDSHSVKIPNHLQVQTEHFSHLSFGSFGPRINAGVSGQAASEALKNKEASSAVNDSSVGDLDNRNYEYYGDERLRTVSDGNIAHRSGASAGSYDSPSVSQPETLKQENSESVQGNQYTFPPSASGYNFESTEHLNPAFQHSQSSSQMPNQAPYSNAYANSLPSSLLASNVQSVRESDHAYSPFPVTQSMPPKYSDTMSSVSGPTFSMPEALRAGHFTSPQLPSKTLPGTSISTGPALPQHLAVHPYFTNMMGYPFLPQSYAYLPSAFQQTFTGSSYHQSLAAILPQYKNNVPVSNFPQSAAVPSGYGAFGSSSSVPGSFLPNPSAAPTGTTIGYGDILSSHYKDANPLISVQQNENSGMWLHGLGSRTLSGVPGSTYYNYQGQQNQQPVGFQQGQQQPTQHLGTLGYPNFYLSQAAMEHHQNPKDGQLAGSQTQQPNQSQQIWQNSY